MLFFPWKNVDDTTRFPGLPKLNNTRQPFYRKSIHPSETDNDNLPEIYFAVSGKGVKSSA